VGLHRLSTALSVAVTTSAFAFMQSNAAFEVLGSNTGSRKKRK